MTVVRRASKIWCEASNQGVFGSSPKRGAKKNAPQKRCFFLGFFFLNLIQRPRSVNRQGNLETNCCLTKAFVVCVSKCLSYERQTKLFYVLRSNRSLNHRGSLVQVQKGSQNKKAEALASAFCFIFLLILDQ